MPVIYRPKIQAALVAHYVVIDSYFADEGVNTERRGVLSTSSLVSALESPFQTFDGENLYSDVLTMAAARLQA